MFFRGEYSFLSNFYDCKIKYHGIVYNNAESCFQAQKCVIEEDKLKFRNLKGWEAKRLGRTVKIVDNWEDIKDDIMFYVCFQKFKQNEELAKKLKNIKGKIEETNNWRDTYWGVCRGVGKNVLGKILEEIRDNI